MQHGYEDAKWSGGSDRDDRTRWDKKHPLLPRERRGGKTFGGPPAIIDIPRNRQRGFKGGLVMSVKIIPISKEYRENYDKVFGPKKVVVKKVTQECVKIYPPVGWVVGGNYQGC